MTKLRASLASLLLAAAALVGLPPVTRAGQSAKGAPAAKQAAAPGETVRRFYAWYLHTLNRNGEPTREKATLRRYLTPRLLKRYLAGSDVDLFLDAQDWDAAWE